jgi:ppGpp synthetase/RelA/SpoT-type nucleotidyltranferase
MTTTNKRKRRGRLDSPSDIWKKEPEIIQHFLNRRADYEQLCTEVAYILKKCVTNSAIEISDIPSRAKTLESFLEKVVRKDYRNPLLDITDFAGVRVVCLYIKDLEKIEAIIANEFDIIERVDKLRSQGTDRFGYGAVHFIVKLGDRPSGARYDNLKDLLCEIQVRTVLQDAWAIIDHHLFYKQVCDVPEQLIRKLNSLAGLLETADDQFEHVRSERNAYLSQVRDQQNDAQKFLSNEINIDSFQEYLTWKFKNMKLSSYDGQFARLFQAIDRRKYRTLADIDSVVDKSAEMRTKITKDLGLLNPTFPTDDSATNQLAMAFFVSDSSFRRKSQKPAWQELVKKHRRKPRNRKPKTSGPFTKR